MQDFPSPSRAPWPSAYEGMISPRGVAKKRRAQELAGMRVKCSRNVVLEQQSWLGSNHRGGDESSRRAKDPVLSGCDPVRLLADGPNRQAVDRPQAGPLAPGNFRFFDSQRQIGPMLKQRFQRASGFDPRKLMAKAEMDPGAEGDVPVRPALQIEPFGMSVCLRVHVGGCQHDHDPVALSQSDAAEFDIFAYVARFGELHRRDEAQKFLDRQVDAAPVLLEPVAQIRVYYKLMD